MPRCSALWQAKKLTYEDARTEFVRCGKNLQHHLTNLTLREKQEDDKVLDAELEEAQKYFMSKEQPRIFVYELDVKWLPEQTVYKKRQKMMVFTGPSQTGKSCHLMKVKGENRTLEVNCAGWRPGQDPPVRGFFRKHHDGMMLDECPPAMIISQKKLFQCGPMKCQLGLSGTNMYMYEISLFRVPVMISSNSWEEEVAALPEPERQWLADNTVVVHIDHKLYDNGAGAKMHGEDYGAMGPKLAKPSRNLSW